MPLEAVIRRTKLLALAAALCLAVTLANSYRAQAQSYDHQTFIYDAVTKSQIDPPVEACLQIGIDSALIITNAASVSHSELILAFNANTSGSNRLFVTGPGSVLNLGGLYVGENGANNNLLINAGGKLVASGFCHLGYFSGSTNNSALITGAGSVWSNGVFFVGGQGSGNKLTVADQAHVFANDKAYVGAGSSQNNALATGTGSFWTNSQNFTVGAYDGSANLLTVSNGAWVAVGENAFLSSESSISTSNNLIVTGAGSLFSVGNTFVPGDKGPSNTVSILDGGKVISRFTVIGMSNSSGNALVVSGTGSLWSNTQSFIVGYANNNRITLTNGGQIISGNVILGDEQHRSLTPQGPVVAGSYDDGDGSFNSALVTGSGSAWISTGTFHVGYWGVSNSLTIRDGGTVAATNITVGTINYFWAVTQSNRLTITGGSLFATNTAGNGTLEARRGSITFNSGTVAVNRLIVTNGASSLMNFNGGLLRSGGSTVSNGITFTVGDGVQSATLDLLGGTHSFANGLKLNTNSSLIGSGDIIASSATNFGIIAPGHSPGTLSFSGSLTLNDSSLLSMEIGGTATNDYDRVWVGGLLRIGGLLDVTLTNGYTGNAGDTFDLFNFGTLTGTFSQTNLPALAGGLQWNTSQLYTLGDISIMSVPEPGAGVLLALGMAALARRRKTNRQRH
ncbi:MAG: PEP-CTERM sorting domain-containing protein [Verrucomicrobia bacterium]|nr:PEP-CTERM sorting domain-containing protein [Verrucomicrobiota bacterium]